MVMLHVPVMGTGTELIVKVIVTQMKYPKKSEAVVDRMVVGFTST